MLGLDLAVGIIAGDSAPGEAWRALFASPRIGECAKDLAFDTPEAADRMIRRGRENLPRILAAVERVGSKAKLPDLGQVGMLEAIRARVTQLRAESGAGNILGVVTAGTFGGMAGQLLQQSGAIGNNEAFRANSADGAWHILNAMDNQLPPYLDTLVGLDIYVLREGRTEWRSLVPSEIRQAASPYRSPPLAGFSIAQGADHIDFTIRRPNRGAFVYRKLPAELAEPADRNEPVTLIAEATPGQGFARVAVTSQREGVFATRLNWQRMEITECPPEIAPRLGFIPNASRVDPSPHVWARALDHEAPAPWREHNASGAFWPQTTQLMTDMIRLPNPPVALFWQLIGLNYGNNVGNLNRWPWAHVEAQERGEEQAPDWFRHIGVFGSDGDLEELPPLAEEFRERLDQLYANQHSPVVARLGGWMYAAVPESIRNASRQCFTQFNQGPVNHIPRSAMKLAFLHVAGLAWNQTDEFTLFFRAMSRAIQSGRIDDMSAAQNDYPVGRPMDVEWLRTLRNIVRFRDNALAADAVQQEDWDTITAYVLQVFHEKCQERFVRRIRGEAITRRLNECLRPMPFMLKRRRVEANYLWNAPPHRPQLDEDLALVARGGVEWQQVYAQATLRFLNEEAREEDVINILQYAD